MFALRCTQKLLTRMKTRPTPPLSAATTLLGDWYASHVNVGRQHLVVCCSERSYLPVVLPARAVAELPARLAASLPALLTALDIPAAEIRREVAEMQAVVVTKTASRVVVGVLTEYARMLRLGSGSDDLLSESLWLAETPLFPSTPRAVWPVEATREALAAPQRAIVVH